MTPRTLTLFAGTFLLLGIFAAKACAGSQSVLVPLFCALFTGLLTVFSWEDDLKQDRPC